MELRGYVQTYENGKKGLFSIVANLHWNPKNKIRKIEETSDKNYAELWIGTYPSGEATLRKTKEKLSKFIEKHPHILGLSSYLSDQFPFLLKVLSIASPTPIKIHPSERLAPIIHKNDPSGHPDSIHQPVLVVALSDFEVIAGLRPKKEIIYFLKEVPELNELIEPSILEAFLKQKKLFYLKKVFECYMNTDKNKLTEAINKYFTRLDSTDFQVRDDHLCEHIGRFHKIFPYDHGVFMQFFLNHFTLKKDEAIYIRSLVPYSFLCGDAIVCTTNSNNDIPITFTSESKELSLFIDYAEFTSFEKKQFIVKPSYEPYSTIYDCDEDAFVVSKVTVHKNNYYTIHGKRTFCVFIVVEGRALTDEETKIKVGTIMLIPPCHTFHMKAIEDMVIFMAEPNLVL